MYGDRPVGVITASNFIAHGKIIITPEAGNYFSWRIGISNSFIVVVS